MITHEKALDHIRELIEYIGEDPTREGLAGTPERILRMWGEIFRGYDTKAKPTITTFSNDSSTTDMVFDTGDYYSMCEHHILPFFGKYYFAYIPSQTGRILGISKVARVVGYCAARMQLQERLVRDIVEMLSDALGGDHQGMALMMRGTHMCKSMRGVRNQGQMTTVYLSGLFEHPEVKQEFYQLVKCQE
ncbi:MAG: GTP cyclohydrolase I [Alloprevotella sp.]|nr:GTP cyclohydrolase I [Alloprevotella sp.]